MKALLLTVLLIGSLPGFGLQSAAPRSEGPQAESTLTPKDEDDIREAVFRYQFEHNASGQQQTARAYFLSVGKDKDPSDDFIARFKDHKPPVKKGSRAIISFEVIDKETGERGGLIFRAGTIKQLDADKVRIREQIAGPELSQ